MKQIILGSGGIIGNSLASALLDYTKDVSVFQRNPRAIDHRFNLIQGDLLQVKDVMKAVVGAEVAYLTVGLKYNSKIWRNQWPVIMSNVIEACRHANCKLVFFDNVYAYGKVNGWMTEETPMDPCSEKGRVRADISHMLMDAVESGRIQALIARSADFYGPNVRNSYSNLMVFDRLAKGKKPRWMLNDEAMHSFTFASDAAKATAVLGNSKEAYDQIWHLPSDHAVMTGREFIEMAAETFDADDESYTLLRKWMMNLGGVFSKMIHENIEMLYQYEFDYLFESSKFEREFNIKATPYKLGMIEILHSIFPNKTS